MIAGGGSEHIANGGLSFGVIFECRLVRGWELSEFSVLERVGFAMKKKAKYLSLRRTQDSLRCSLGSGPAWLKAHGDLETQAFWLR